MKHNKSRDGQSSNAEVEQAPEEESEANSSSGGVASPSENDGDEGVDISPEFQQAMHKHLSKANKHEIAHARSKMNTREDEIRKQEEMMNAKHTKTPKEFSTEGMPSSV